MFVPLAYLCTYNIDLLYLHLLLPPQVCLMTTLAWSCLLPTASSASRCQSTMWLNATGGRGSSSEHQPHQAQQQQQQQQGRQQGLLLV
jgi:hypothetical protein